MPKRCLLILLAVAIVFAALVIGVKAEAIRPNMIFEPAGAKGVDTSEH